MNPSFFRQTKMAILIFCLTIYSISGIGQTLVTVSAANVDETFKEAVTQFLGGEFDTAIVHFKEAQEIYRNQRNYRQVVACFLGLTNCHFFKEDYKQALFYCETALALHKREVKDDPEGLDTLTITESLCKTALHQSKANANPE